MGGGEIKEGKEAKSYINYMELNNKNTSYMYIFKFKEKQYVIDSEKTNEIGRYINHSKKDKNVKAVVHEIDNIIYLVFEVSIHYIYI